MNSIFLFQLRFFLKSCLYLFLWQRYHNNDNSIRIKKICIHNKLSSISTFTSRIIENEARNDLYCQECFKFDKDWRNKHLRNWKLFSNKIWKYQQEAIYFEQYQQISHLLLNDANELNETIWEELSSNWS